MATLDTLQDAVNNLTASTTTLLNEVNVNKTTLVNSANSAAGSASAAASSASAASTSASNASNSANAASNSAANAAAAASSASQIVLGVASGYPNIDPSLSLDFANTKALDPRITFARASTARFYDGRSTAKAEENLLIRSQEFDDAAWAKTNTTVTANNAVAPDGTTTAETLLATDANATTLQTVVAVAGDYTFSVFLRRVSGTGNVDISAHSGGTWVTQSITSSWARYTVTQTLTAGSRTPGIRIVADTDSIEVWGAQLEQRSSVTAYTPTTTQPITNYVPVLQSAANNVARFDHNPVTGESLGLLIEEQRTNLLVRSEEFDNASWNKERVSITANTIVAPDGTLTAEKIVEDLNNNSHRVIQAVSGLTPLATYAISFYLKKGERTVAYIQDGGAGLTNSASLFNLDTGVATKGPNSSHVSVQMTPVSNGWFRCTLVYQVPAGITSVSWILGIFVGGFTVYTGDGYSGIYIWGAQLEAGAFPTSYIPTVASQVTRSADAASMTGANFSSWYRADEGTLYAESIAPAGIGAPNAWVFSLDNGSISERMFGRYNASTFTTTFAIGALGASQALLTSVAGFTNRQSVKTASTFKTDDVATSTNGASVLTDTSAYIPPNINVLRIGGSDPSLVAYLNSTIKKLAFYPRRISNAELQALTQN
jgi:hypothetical protein